ncbi:MAG: PhzF family phenazine biosynthesis protein [Candidatus Eisenbacteria bacterium]|uniref:PhzF family phenazine biosynthesis protein n=1 Tax=Eiseniibacteriota bacterium TaxID=2212470 RepID=A0A7Y2H1T0_UNCEI|nr:PhzF family phenazine biosynthesis protein [Candidatus Eisenbacteria bacterium]
MSEPVQVYIVHGFTMDDEGGNPAGVVLNADALSRRERQAIAAEMALSETAFFSHSDRADFKVEFYTPNRQIPHCGHATIASFFLLQQQGHIKCPLSSKETIEDVRKITFAKDGVFMEQKKPSFNTFAEDSEETAVIAEALGTKSDAFANAPSVVSTGNPWLIVQLQSLEALKGLSPDFPKLETLSGQLGTIGFYPYVLMEDGSLKSRMFAPLFGIEEESATGTAAGPCACYHQHFVDPQKHRYDIYQGELMTPPSPSHLIARLNVGAGEIQNLMVGGQAALKGTRELANVG